MMSHQLGFPVGSEGLCFDYYGQFSKSDARDCIRAIKILETGSSKVEYTVNRGGDTHVLPFTVQSGQSVR